MRRRPLPIAVLVVGAIVLSIVVVVVVKVLDDDGEPAPEAATRALSSVIEHAVPAQAPFEGLGAVEAAIGTDHCLRLAVADTEAERAAGLRGNAADLGVYDGMLFVFPAPTETAFTMSGVTAPLDIAFFTSDGARTSTAAMQPCPEKAESECPVYRPERPFTYAVETRAGQLPDGPITACNST